MIGRLRPPLPWVGSTDPLPDPQRAWQEPNGLLAAGADLSQERLLEAYSRGIFPWYSDGQPVLWWSPDPRMVLYLDEFRLHRSLAKTIRRHRRAAHPTGADRKPADPEGGAAAPTSFEPWRVSLDRCFEAVMLGCSAPRETDDGTWITGEMRRAYIGLHQRGYAHSVEVWQGSSLIGGLYGVSIGRMFYGESMFTRVADASKVALASLVQVLIRHDFRVLDCQQNTRHLASLGAREVSRQQFLAEVADLIRQPGPDWRAIGIELPDA